MCIDCVHHTKDGGANVNSPIDLRLTQASADKLIDDTTADRRMESFTFFMRMIFESWSFVSGSGIVLSVACPCTEERAIYDTALLTFEKIAFEVKAL